MHLTDRLRIRPSADWVVALTLFVLITPHWLLTRDFADGALVSFARTNGSPDALFAWFKDSNWLIPVAFYRAVFALSDFSGASYLILTKCALTVLVAWLYVECRLWARDVFRLPSDQARLAALLCVASPSLYTLANSTGTVNLLCICLVMSGHRLYWSERIPVRLMGLVLLIFSFQVNSNLVFAVALELVRWWRFRHLQKNRMLWFLALIAAVLFAYLFIRIISPPKQFFTQYNQLLNPLNMDDLKRLLRAVVMFVTWGIIPLLAVVLVAMTRFVSRNRLANPLQTGMYIPEGFASLAALLFLAGAAVFPYVMVGKGAPLFTPTAYGNGITEQVLRAAYSGPIAPTWANTSTRHGFLLSIPVGLMTWVAACMLVRKMRLRWTPQGLYALLLPLALIWVLPAYANKLQNQWAEISLVKGFRALQPAKPGIVELRYQPVSSWIFWTSSANVILREAWSSSTHLGFFHSLDVYRDDLYWQYHTYFLDKGVLQSRLLQNMAALDGFPGADCLTRYEGSWVSPSLWQMTFAGWFPENVPAANIRQIDASCEIGRQLPNPNSGKKVIY